MYSFLKPAGLASLFTGLAVAANVQAYDVIAVDNGGEITGTITVSGPVPVARRFKVEKTPEVCGEADRLVEEVRARDGKLADVVVLLEAVDAGKAYPSEEAMGGPPDATFRSREPGGGAEFPGLTLKPKICIFGPYTSVIAEGKMMNFRNQDPVKHSPHTYGSKGRVMTTMHNEDLPGEGELDLEVKFSKARTKVLKLECDQHEHMQNWFRKVDNPYYAFTDETGTFRIDQVPPGTYKLIAWHPKFKREQSQEITVAASGAATADFEFKIRVRKGAKKQAANQAEQPGG